MKMDIIIVGVITVTTGDPEEKTPPKDGNNIKRG